MKARIQDSVFRIQAGQAKVPVRPLFLSTRHSALSTQHSKGFTLIEMIVVIVITGIIAGMVAMFIRAPVEGYISSSHRAEMTDIADTALRRMGRDLRTAVPNSVRMPIPAGSTYFEFLPTRDGGRYRVDPTDGAGGCAAVAGNTLGDALNFDAADTCFEIVGPAIATSVGDAIVIGSTQSDGNQPYQLVTSATGVRRMVSAAGTTTVQVTSGTPLPASSELQGHRFAVVPAAEGAVTYACVNPGGGACGVDADGDGTCQLVRVSAYGYSAIQALPATVGAPILAQRVSACNFVYNTDNQRNSLLAARLVITRGNESVNLYHEVHINNIP
ncbi:MAG: prepilin-type N-terminal cleavage/methylation domain-containing protein [Pseudomonadota bacterium]